MIQEQALLYADVRMATLSGEAADVSESVVEDWGRRLSQCVKVTS